MSVGGTIRGCPPYVVYEGEVREEHTRGDIGILIDIIEDGRRSQTGMGIGTGNGVENREGNRNREAGRGLGQGVG